MITWTKNNRCSQSDVHCYHTKHPNVRAEPSVMCLVSLLCSPSAQIVNRMKIMCFVSNVAVIMGLCTRTFVCQKLALVYHLWQSVRAFLGARAAELLINADQSPQRGGNGPQTLDCLRLPCARSHRCWIHSVQPQL